MNYVSIKLLAKNVTEKEEQKLKSFIKVKTYKFLEPVIKCHGLIKIQNEDSKQTILFNSGI